MNELLKVDHLTVDFSTDQGTVHAVRDVSFCVYPQEVLGIVGESGSGKSQTMYSVMGLLADNGKITAEDILFDGKKIHESAFKNHLEYEKTMQHIRGNDMAMIFQDPMTFLNPVLKIGTQLIEPLQNHTKMSKKECEQKAIELMRQVGGMRQRIIIAMALACNPKLIIADEPTTALDVTIQAQVLELIQDMKEKLGSSVIMITHDLGVVASLCNRIAIMYGGKIVEIGTDKEIFYEPKHPYTQGLLNCINNPEDDDKDLQPIPGSPPDLLNPPKGCPFVDRCEKAMKICKQQMPSATAFSKTHECACWLNELKKREGKK